MVYVFFTPELGGMGGTQMFIYNKGLFLRELGWEVCFCYFTKSEIKIKGIDDFKNYYLPESIWGIEHYSKRFVDKRIDAVIKNLELKKGEDIIIESNLMSLSFWAEILAEKVQGLHILNCLEENIPYYFSGVYTYLEFKLKRWEIMNASEKSLNRAFKDYFIPDYLQYLNCIKTPCSNVLSKNDESFDVTPYERADYNILSIGRLDKPYIYKAVSEVKRVIGAHVDKVFNLVFIGASKDGKSEKDIQEQFGTLDNVTVFFLGYLFPIPSSLLACMTVSLATSNSVLVSYNAGIPTIAIDAQDYDAIGIYGYNTNNKVFRHGEQRVPVGDYLETILFDKDFKYSNTPIQTEDTGKEEFKKQLSFVTGRERKKEYYPVQGLYGILSRLKGTIIRVLYTFKHSVFR